MFGVVSCDPLVARATPACLTPRMERQPRNRIKAHIPKPITPRDVGSYKRSNRSILGSGMDLGAFNKNKASMYSSVCARRAKVLLDRKRAFQKGPKADVVGEYRWRDTDRELGITSAKRALSRLT